VFLSARTARSRVIPYMHVACMDQNIKNTIVCINSNITEIWHDIAKPISRQILQGLKQRKRNSVLIISNVLTARTIITTVYFRNADLTGTGTTRNYKSSKKSE